MIGTGSLVRIGRLAISSRDGGGGSSPDCRMGGVLIAEVSVMSERGEGAMGNLNSDRATGGLRGEAMASMLGVLGAVDAPESRLKGEPRSGG